jgi:hypothetical protein
MCAACVLAVAVVAPRSLKDPRKRGEPGWHLASTASAECRVDPREAAEKRAVAGVGVGAESTAKPEMSSREGRDGGGRADGMRSSSAAQAFGKFLELSARLGAEALPAFTSSLQSNTALFGAHRLHPGTTASYEGPCIAMKRCQCNRLMPPPRASNSTLDALDQQATL